MHIMPWNFIMKRSRSSLLITNFPHGKVNLPSASRTPSSITNSELLTWSRQGLSTSFVAYRTFNVLNEEQWAMGAHLTVVGDSRRGGTTHSLKPTLKTAFHGFSHDLQKKKETKTTSYAGSWKTPRSSVHLGI